MSILPSCQSGILEDLYTGYLGITKTQLRATLDIYWPKINEQTKNSKHLSAVNHVVRPKYFWSVLGTDLFEIGGVNYLIIADYYTKHIVVEELPNPCLSKVVAGITNEIVSLGFLKLYLATIDTTFLDKLTRSLPMVGTSIISHRILDTRKAVNS